MRPIFPRAAILVLFALGASLSDALCDRITSVSVSRITVSTPAGERQFAITKETEIRANGREVQIENLTVGMQVEVRPSETDETRAQRITAKGDLKLMNTDSVVYVPQKPNRPAKKEREDDNGPRIVSGSDGLVLSVSPAAIVISSAETQSRTYRVGKDTEVTVEGKAASVREIIVGMQAEVTPVEGDESIAGSIRASRAKRSPKRR